MTLMGLADYLIDKLQAGRKLTLQLDRARGRTLVPGVSVIGRPEWELQPRSFTGVVR